MRRLIACRMSVNTFRESRGDQQMATMLDSILGMVTPEMKQALASRLGESTQGVQTGLGTAAAATLGGLANKASDSGFLSQILGLLGGGAGGNILGSLSAPPATWSTSSCRWCSVHSRSRLRAPSRNRQA